MHEQFARVGAIELCYEVFEPDPGIPDPETLLLVMGLGAQMIAWPQDLCRELAGRGFRVLRFDNRDAGRSTHLADVPPPTVAQLARGRRFDAPYRLEDLARDAAGLLDVLDLGPAHVVGASMGGMIAQTLAAHHPGHVRSLCSIMSTTGSRRVGQPALRLLPALLRRAPADRERFIEHTMGVFGEIGSTGFERDEAELRRVTAMAFDRGADPAGTARQLGAILASGDRTAALRGIRAPTVVVHGTADRLIPPSGGKATAKAIPGAELVLIEGMGHDLPRGAWPRIIEAISRNADRADQTQVAA